MKNFFSFKRISATVLGFFGIGALTACYGVEPNAYQENENLVYGNITDSQGKAVQGIKVYQNTAPENFVTTDSNGYYELNIGEDASEIHIIYFEDVDGQENGKYQKDSILVDFSQSNIFNKDITLKKNNE